MSAAAPLRLAIFDCDGTLVDSQHMIAACMSAAFAAEGLAAPPVEAVRRVVGLPLARCMELLAPGREAADHERLVEAFRHAFHLPRPGGEDGLEPLFPGCRETLDALQLSRRFLLDKPVDFAELFGNFFGSESLTIQPSFRNDFLAVLLIRNHSQKARADGCD